VGQHFVTTNFFSCIFDGGNRRHVDIVHPAALTAPDVVVIRGGGVETPLRTRNIHFPNQSVVGQDLQIAVHGRDADLGKLVSNQTVQFFGSGVARELPEFF